MTLNITTKLLLGIAFILCVVSIFAHGCKGVKADPADVQITFEWTAPGDDGLLGQASVTTIKYALTADSLADQWDNCTQVGGIPEPLPAGSHESHAVTLSLFSETPYFFALKVADNVGNWSVLSNVVEVEIADTIPPAGVSDLQATF